MAKALPEAAELLGKALRAIAEFDWSLHALGKSPDLSLAARAHEDLLTVRRLLMESGYAPWRLPPSLCRHIVETDRVVVALRVHAGEVSRAMARAVEGAASPAPSEEKARRLADFLAPMVGELVRTRNRCARDLGADDYAALILASLGLDREQLEHWLGDVAAALGGQLADAGAPVSRDETRWLPYHDDVDQRLHEQEALAAFRDHSVPEWAKLVGLDPARLRGDLRADAAIRGWCLPVDRPGDVRLVLTAKQGTLPLRLVLHELGHYLHYTVAAPDGWQLTAPPPIFDETMASLLELAGSQEGVRDRIAPLLVRPSGPHEPLLRVAKQRQWALSALFELQAYERDGESLDALWEEILRGAGFALTFPGEWALDRFYVDDPVYRFNYVVGALWSARELGQMSPCSLRDAAARIRELGEAAYRSPWRSVLGLEDALPEIDDLKAA